ncbi:MAG: septum formation initiator family protein [Desulfoarculaceae bacterium]|nr:septum formation initiator family protein [Desulfoarculaceae bacterium]
MKRTYKASLSPMQQKKMFHLSLLLVVLFLLMIVFAPGKGLLFLRKQKMQVDALHAEKQELVEKNNALREEINRVKTDVNYLEQVARGQHGLLKKDEMVFDFSPKERNKRE